MYMQLPSPLPFEWRYPSWLRPWALLHSMLRLTEEVQITVWKGAILAAQVCQARPAPFWRLRHACQPTQVLPTCHIIMALMAWDLTCGDACWPELLIQAPGLLSVHIRPGGCSLTAEVDCSQGLETTQHVCTLVLDWYFSTRASGVSALRSKLAQSSNMARMVAAPGRQCRPARHFGHAPLSAELAASRPKEAWSTHSPT